MLLTRQLPIAYRVRHLVQALSLQRLICNSSQAIAFPLIPNIERLAVHSAPADIDPRVLAWKGVATMCRFDVLVDLWITGNEWVSWNWVTWRSSDRRF